MIQYLNFSHHFINLENLNLFSYKIRHIEHHILPDRHRNYFMLINADVDSIIVA